MGKYKFCQNLPNTEHGGDRAAKADTGNSESTAVSSKNNAYTTDEYIRTTGASYCRIVNSGTTGKGTIFNRWDHTRHHTTEKKIQGENTLQGIRRG